MEVFALIVFWGLFIAALAYFDQITIQTTLLVTWALLLLGGLVTFIFAALR